MKNKILLFVFASVTLALVIAGCASTPKINAVPWTLKITKRTSASIEMDVIGVTATDQKYFEGMSWEDYWKPDSQIRRDALPKSQQQSKFLEQTTPWVISAKDRELWDQWLKHGVVELLLVARLPEAGGLWKVPVSLDKKAWKAQKQTIEVEVLDSRIVVTTPPRD